MEKIFLRDKKIGHCVACGTCQSNGGRCIQHDDMAEVLDKMIHADVLVMATPVYFYNMNGQMKTLIDRTYKIYRDQQFGSTRLKFTFPSFNERSSLQEVYPREAGQVNQQAQFQN